MTSSLLALGAPVQRWPRSSPRAGASVLLLDKDRLPSDQILSTHTIHPPGLDVLDDGCRRRSPRGGAADAYRAAAKNEAFVDIEFR